MTFLLGLLLTAQVHAQTTQTSAPRLQVLGALEYTMEAKVNSKAQHTFIFTNVGVQPITQIQILPMGSPFTVDDMNTPTLTTCYGTLAAGGRCTVSVTFQPADTSSAASMVILSYNDGTETQAAFANILGNVKQ